MPGGCLSQGCHRYTTFTVSFALRLCNPFRNHSPSSLIVDEFNADDLPNGSPGMRPMDYPGPRGFS